MLNARELFSALKSDIYDWCEGRTWYIRLPLLVYLYWAGAHHVMDHEYSSWFGGLIFGLHELGHVIFRAFGEFIGIAGGSFNQVITPIIGAGVLYTQRDYFGISVTGCWLSYSLYNLATYIGDAQVQQLPLLSIGGGDSYHDWEYLLVHLNLLERDTQIASMTRVLAFAVLMASLYFGTWLCYRMIRKPTENSESRADYLNRNKPRRAA